MAKPETRLVHRVLEALGREFPGSYFRKIHGSPFQHAGIPDIIGCVEGLFVGLEVKTEEGKVSRIQAIEGINILTAGGIHAVVTSPEMAIYAITKAKSFTGPRSA